MPPSCDCGASVCNCVLSAGPGVSISGAGTATSPYVIGAGAGAGVVGGVVPTGAIMMWPGATIPEGWLECNGQAFARFNPDGTETALFTVLGTSWGPGDGATTASLPPLSGRFPLGVSGAWPMGATGGASQVTLAAGNLPAHTHGIGHTHTMPHTHGMSNHTHTADPAAFVSAGPSTASTASYDPPAVNSSGAGGHSHLFDIRRAEGANTQNEPQEGKGPDTGNARTTAVGNHVHSVNLPAHNHGMPHTHSINVPPFTSAAASPANTAGSSAANTGPASGDSGSTGQSQAIPTMPPFVALRYIIKS